MKSRIFLLLMMACSFLQAQTSSENYVYTQTYRVATATEYTGANLVPANVVEEIGYVDGLGRPLQMVIRKGSPSQKDMIQPVAYDAYGRTVKSYLPFSYDNGGSAGAYLSTALTSQASFYQTAAKVAKSVYPYTEVVYENSPQDRVLEQGSPGEVWKIGAGHTVTNEQWFTVPEVKWYVVDGSGNLAAGAQTYYPNGYVTAVYVTDEQGNKSREVKDALGRVIMKEVGIINDDNAQRVRTYYIYDDLGNLRYVLSPQYHYAGSMTDQQKLDAYVYVYKYDERQRLIYKKLPGVDPVYYVYAPNNRLILEQDGNLRGQSKWKFYKYDAFGRMIQMGTCTPIVGGSQPSPTTAHRVSTTSKITSDYFISPANYFNNFTNFYEERSGAGSGYTDCTYPPASVINETLLTSYYDDYDFLSAGTSTPLTNATTDYTNNKGKGYSELINATNNPRVKCLTTKTITKYLDGSGNTVTGNMYYDKFGRSVQSQQVHTNGNKVIDNSAYNFEGKPVTVQSFYYKNQSPIDTNRVTHRYIYGVGSILTHHYLKAGNNADKLIACLGYNEIGQLTEKGLNNTTGSNFLQSIDYRYNIRGWLKQINNPHLMNDSTYMVTQSNINYVNSKLTSLNNIHSQVTSGAHDEAWGINQINTILGDVVTEYYTNPSNGAAQYIARSFDDYGTAVRTVYTPLYTFLYNLFNEFLSGNFVNNDANDLLGMELNYEQYTDELSCSAQYNGNISYIKIKTATPGNNQIKGYGFSYDRFDRLTAGTYAEFSIPGDLGSYIAQATTTAFRWKNAVNRFDEYGITYDLNGNINTLKRKGNDNNTTPSTYGTIDDLTYTYNGNQLKKVEDASTNSAHKLQFTNGVTQTTEYTYDVNGNMISDANKGITSTTYNILNLPQLITFSSGNKIEYTYDATGQKLKKLNKNSGGTVTSAKEYLTEAEYSGTTTANVLEAIYHDEGRLTKSGSTYKYEYTLRDHLGNSRVMFCDLDANNSINTGSEILQQQDYYPFGLQHRGYTSPQVGTNNKYQYNGKEWVDDQNLNELDYGARFYMSDIGRWGGVNPLAEKFRRISPYVYVANNPLIFMDPDGMKIEYASKEEKKVLKPLIKELKRTSGTAKKLINDLRRSDNVHTFSLAKLDPKTGKTEGSHTDPLELYAAGSQGTKITINPNQKVPNEKGNALSNIGHEIGHAWRRDQGLVPQMPEIIVGEPISTTVDKQIKGCEISNNEEFEVSHIENMIKAEIDPTGETLPLRKTYGLVEVKTKVPGQIFAKTTFEILNIFRPDYDYYNQSSKENYNSLKK